MSSRTPGFDRATAAHDKRLDSPRVITEPSARRNKQLPPPPSTLAREKTISFASKWAYGVVTVAASIVFGIWAPLSYRASTSGNASNNEVQSSMVSVMSNSGEVASKANEMASAANKLAATANGMATTANDMALTANGMASELLSTAIAQGTALAAMQTRLDLIGQLAMVDFCITQSVSFVLDANVDTLWLMTQTWHAQTLNACSPLYQSADVVIESLAGGLLGNPTVNTAPGGIFSSPTGSAIPGLSESLVPVQSVTLRPIVSAVVPVASVTLPGGSVVLNPSAAEDLSVAATILSGETVVPNTLASGVVPVASVTYPSNTQLPPPSSITDSNRLEVSTAAYGSAWFTSALISPVSRTALASATTSLSTPSTLFKSPTTSPKTTSGEPSEPPATSSESAGVTSAHQYPGSGVTIPVEAILGIVFGSTAIVGALLGFMVWQLRKSRLTMHEE